MMERAESGQKLYTRMRLWEFPDQFIVEPTDGSSGSALAISRADGSMNLIHEVPECSILRVPKIRTIFGVVGVLKLLAGLFLFIYIYIYTHFLCIVLLMLRSIHLFYFFM